MAEYFKSFLIGSSWPVFIYFFYVVSQYPSTTKTFSYEYYTFIAPIFLGLLNMFGLFLSKQYDFTRTQRFLITAIIGATLVSITITLFKVYNFPTVGRWIHKYITLYLTYIFIFGFVVNLLDFSLGHS